jgi:creatinine amidohydrolase
MTSEVRLQWLRPSEVQARRSIVYLPLGPLEWHGPHLPLGTDPLQAESLALALAARVGGVVHPTLYWGTERERSPEILRNLGFQGHEWIVGMDFPGNAMRSYYAPEEQFALVVRWTLENLVAHAFRLIVVVNGHGATNQIEQLQRLVAEFNARGGPARLLYTFPLDYVTTEPGHATLTETAALLALDAARVDLAALPAPAEPLRIPEWAVADAQSFAGHPTADYAVPPEADPRRATPEIGQRNFEAALLTLTEMVNAAWANLP